LHDASRDALIRLGGQAASGVPTLGQSLRRVSPQQRFAIYSVLGAVGSAEATDILIEWLALEDQRRDPIASALRDIGAPEATPAVPGLVELLEDSDEEARFEAVHALGAIGETDGRVARALTSALDDASSRVADSAIHALGRLQTVEAVEVLELLLPTTSGVRQSRVISSLGESGPAAGIAVAALLDVMRASGDERRVTDVLEALTQIGPSAEAAIPVLLELLFSPEAKGWVPIMAATALGSIGASAVGPLLDAWEQRRPPRQVSLERALEQFGEEAVPALGEALQRESPWTREAVARRLGAFPARAAIAGPLLHELVREDEEDRVRDAAAVALGRLGWPSTTTVAEAEHLGLVSKIGEGALGTVWLAEDSQLGRQVAVKVFKVAGAGSINWLEQGQALARVNHPNVNKVYYVDHVRDPESGAVVPALVLELVDGRSLEEVLKAPPAATQLRAMGLQVLAALRALHEAGVYHLDLHEENIMVDEAGHVSLIDINYLTSLAPLSASRRATRDRLEFNGLYGVLLRLLSVAEAPAEARETLVRLLAQEVYDLGTIREKFVLAFGESTGT